MNSPQTGTSAGSCGASLRRKLQYQLRAALRTCLDLPGNFKEAESIQKHVHKALSSLGVAVDVESLKANVQQQGAKRMREGAHADTPPNRNKKGKHSVQQGSAARDNKQNGTGQQQQLQQLKQHAAQQQHEGLKEEADKQHKPKQKPGKQQQRPKQSSSQPGSTERALSVRQKKRIASQAKAAAAMLEQLTAAGVQVPSAAGYYQLQKLKIRTVSHQAAKSTAALQAESQAAAAASGSAGSEHHAQIKKGATRKKKKEDMHQGNKEDKTKHKATRAKPTKEH